MNTSQITEKILRLHTEKFLPLQYSKKRLAEGVIQPTIRIHMFGNRFFVDIIVWNGKEHDFMDGGFYDNGDGVGTSLDLTKALKDLLRKTNRSIKVNELDKD